MYKVTLTMPIYNVSSCVETSLLSALNQTFESIEFLLVDDCGTDDSMAIVRRIKDTHPRGKDIRIIEHPQNAGTGAARNTAITQATGEFLYFMDSDDCIIPNCIQLLYNAMMEDPVDFVSASYKRVREDSSFIHSHKQPNVQFNNRFELADYFYVKRGNFVIPLWNKLFNVQFLRKNELYCIPNHINEDTCFCMNLILKTSSARLMCDITYLYYVRGTSTEAVRQNSFSVRYANQYVDAVKLLVKNMPSYKTTSVYGAYLAWCLAFVENKCIEVINSNLLTEEDKKKYISIYTDLGISFHQLLRIVPFSFKNLYYITACSLPFSLHRLSLKAYQSLLRLCK